MRPPSAAPVARADAPTRDNASRALPPLRTTFEILIDAAGAVDSRAPPPLWQPAQPFSAQVETPLHPTMRLEARAGILHARLPPLLPSLAPSLKTMTKGHSVDAPPLNTKTEHTAQTCNQPESSLPLAPPQRLPCLRGSMAQKACLILPRAPASTLKPAPPLALAPPPPVAPSRRGTGLPPSSTALLAGGAMHVAPTRQSTALSEMEKRQLIRKMRNREAAARSNHKRKMRHNKLKNELTKAHEREKTLRKLEASLKEENINLKSALDVN